MIKNIKNQGNTIEWEYNNSTIEKNAHDVVSFLIDKSGRFVLMLYHNKESGAKSIIEFSGDGKEILQISPPENYSFYYLSQHPKAPISVVCQGPSDEFGRTDYHFSINTSNGSLTLLGLAY